MNTTTYRVTSAVERATDRLWDPAAEEGVSYSQRRDEVRAALAAALDVEEMAPLMNRCTTWEMNLLGASGPYIGCTECGAHVLDDPAFLWDDDEPGPSIDPDDAARIRAAGMRHHAAAVRAAIIGNDKSDSADTDPWGDSTDPESSAAARAYGLDYSNAILGKSGE